MLFKPDQIIRLKTVGSTNDYMIEQVSSGKIITEGAVVIAGEQTRGRGLDKNSWESEPGKNLTFSVLLKPQFLRADQQFMLNKSVSLAIFDFIRNHVGSHKVCIKWPNDIYVENLKVAGVLISNTIIGNKLLNSVAGIGVNINQDKFSELTRNPVSLKHILKKELDLELAFQNLLYWLEYRYEQLRNHQVNKINSDYLGSLYRINELHFFIYKGEILSARITGVSDYGHLQITTNTLEKLECDFREIKFVIQPNLINS